MMDALCTQFKIHHQNSILYRPKMKGTTKAINKNVKKNFKKMIETNGDWHWKLLYALLTYRTSIRSSTKGASFSFVYGMEAVRPIEVETASLRILIETELEEAKLAHSRMINWTLSRKRGWLPHVKVNATRSYRSGIWQKGQTLSEKVVLFLKRCCP